MNRIVYVNGAYMPEQEATVSIFDRGFLMADGVYEVTSVLQGKLIDFQAAGLPGLGFARHSGATTGDFGDDHFA
jgi:hypothetical protein